MRRLAVWTQQLAIAVADAHDIIRDNARWTTRAAGGRGAVREVCEALLTAKGLWDEIAGQYLKP